MFGFNKNDDMKIRKNGLILSELSYYLKDLDIYFKNDENKKNSPYLYNKYLEFMNVIEAIIKNGRVL